jgi:hypothetical protein
MEARDMTMNDTCHASQSVPPREERAQVGRETIEPRRERRVRREVELTCGSIMSSIQSIDFDWLQDPNNV